MSHLPTTPRARYTTRRGCISGRASLRFLVAKGVVLSPSSRNRRPAGNNLPRKVHPCRDETKFLSAGNFIEPIRWRWNFYRISRGGEGGEGGGERGGSERAKTRCNVNYSIRRALKFEGKKGSVNLTSVCLVATLHCELRKLIFNLFKNKLNIYII